MTFKNIAIRALAAASIFAFSGSPGYSAGTMAIWAPGAFVTNAGAALIYDFNNVSMTFGTTFFIPIQAPANKTVTKLAFVMCS
ncbi:MAG: hypothetical protein M3Z96_08890 [Pseudomonadota bacterium]|nr:hypothetical protein [Pseudomonadota bacterium]